MRGPLVLTSLPKESFEPVVGTVFVAAAAVAMLPGLVPGLEQLEPVERH